MLSPSDRAGITNALFPGRTLRGVVNHTPYLWRGVYTNQTLRRKTFHTRRHPVRELSSNMKRLTFRLAVAVITFSFGSIAAWFCYQETASPPTIPVTFGSVSNRSKPSKPMLPKLSDIPANIEEDAKVTLQFVTENVGWLAINGRLWRTRDGGRQWVPIRIVNPATDRDELIDHVQFIYDDRGWATTDRGLYRTSDGGENLFLLRSSTGVDTDGVRLLTGFAFLRDGATGWIIENRYRALREGEVPGSPHTEYSSDGNHVMSSFIYHTEDGGETWTPQSITPTWNALENITAIEPGGAVAFGIAGVYFLDGDEWKRAEGKVGGLGSDCLMAGCGSGCWIPTTIGFVDERSGWIANSGGSVGRTFDGGRTWTDISYDIGQGFTDHMYDVQVQFYDENRGWGLNGNGHLITSRDGGESWQLLDNSQSFTRMFILDGQHGWAVSNEGVFSIPMEAQGN